MMVQAFGVKREDNRDLLAPLVDGKTCPFQTLEEQEDLLAQVEGCHQDLG